MSHLDDATAAFEAGDLGTALASLDRHYHHVPTREPTREGATAGRELAARIRAASHGRQARRAGDQERWFGELEEHLQPAGSPAARSPRGRPLSIPAAPVRPLR